ncbi:F-box domain-containing protein [Colletotrichum asianum]
MFEDALDTKKLRFNTNNIVWLNKNNGESKLQVSYIAYGNEPSTAEIYSYFAMVVQAPKKANAGDNEAAQKRTREE